LVAGLFLAGCNTTPPQISSAKRADDFGAEITADDEINIETVQRNQMLHQRAQVELRLGPTFPFDIFDPSREARTDGVSFGIGAKASLETQKNVFWGFAIDYQSQEIENLPEGLNEQINTVSYYDRFAFLGTFDYDIPVTEAPDALIIRLGLGIGLVVFKFEDDDLGQIEDVYQILFRPAVGVRYPVHENIVIFTEFAYDLIPDKRLGTKEDQGISGKRPVLSSGAIWFGAAFEW
jgi:hypothetical protein